MPWSPGERVTLRYVGHSRRDAPDTPGLLQGWPYRVVQDEPDLLALWMPVGTRMKLVDLADRGRAVADLVHGEHPHDAFRRGEVLRLMQPGRPYSIWFHWTADAERRFLGWYVNLEAPFVRTPIGIDTTDDSLDIVATPDLEWHWKDEELTSDWIAAGVYTAEEMAAIHESGLLVIRDIEARRFPFDGGWLDWRPDAGWQAPEVHPGWAALPGYDLSLSTGRRLRNVDHPSPPGGAPLRPRS